MTLSATASQSQCLSDWEKNLNNDTLFATNHFCSCKPIYGVGKKRQINGEMGFGRLCLLGNCIGRWIPVCISDVYWAIYFSHISVCSYRKWCFQFRVNSLLVFFHFELCGLRLDSCIGTVPRKQTHSKGQCATFNQFFFLDAGQKKIMTVCSQGKSCKTSQKSPCSGLSDARSSGATENRDWRYDFFLCSTFPGH